MSAIYNIDFKLAAERLSPPSKRSNLYLTWLGVLLSPLQGLRDLIFNEFANGITVDLYSSSVQYEFGDHVQFQGRVYENVNLQGSLNSKPTDLHNWVLLFDNVAGIRERINYSGQTIVLEGILNKKFNEPANPQIKINNTDNDIDYVYFYNEAEDYPAVYFTLLLDTETPSKPVYFYYQQEYHPPEDFKVEVPIDLLTDPMDEDEMALFTQLIDAEVLKYKIAGVTHSIIYY